MLQDVIGKVNAIGDIVRMRFTRGDTETEPACVTMWVRSHRNMVVRSACGADAEEAVVRCARAILDALGVVA